MSKSSPDKAEYVIHIKKNSKQALNHELVLKNTLRVIKINQTAWLNPYIDMNTNFKKVNMTLRKTFSSWWTKFCKIWEIIEIAEIIRNYLVSEPNYQQQVFHRISISKRNEKNANTYE